METLILFHGTTRAFDTFDRSKARSTLNDKFQGDGIFFTGSLDVAWRYADAARNAKLDPVETRAAVAERCCNHPLIMKLWDRLIANDYETAWTPIADKVDVIRKMMGDAEAMGIDLNDMCDLAKEVEGARCARAPDELESIFSIMSGSHDSMVHWLPETAQKFGLDVGPRVVIAHVSFENMLETDDRETARTAFGAGYDIVRYSGEGIVSGVSEYMVRSSEQVKILRTLLPEPELEDEAAPSFGFGR